MIFMNLLGPGTLVKCNALKLYAYRTRAILTRGLHTFYPLFEVHLCTVTFGLKLYRVSIQERVIVAGVWYIDKKIVKCGGWKKVQNS